MTYIHIVGQKDITVVVDPVKHLKHKIQCSSIRWTDSQYEVDMHTVKLFVNFYLFTFLLKQTQLQALIKLGFFDLPQLEKLLLPRMYLVKKLHDLRYARLHVWVTCHITSTRITA